MKNVFYHIGLLAVATLAFASCAKETEAPNKGRTHTVKVTVDKIDTKTAIVEGATEASYKWTTGDDAYFHIYENGVEAQSIHMDLSSDEKIATFTATFADTQASEYVYTAKFAKESSNAGNPTIQTEQSPKLDSYDPSADIMIANSITQSTQPASLQFSLRRVISVNKMTLKELEAGEVISSVEITSDKSIGGQFILATSEAAEHYSLSGKKLTLTYDPASVDATVPASGEFSVYFVCGPADANQLSIRVVTDKNVYERNDFTSTVDFKVGVVKRFGVKLGTYGTPVVAGTPYVLVNSQAELVDGATYLIVGGDTYAMGEQKSNNRGAVAVTPVSDVITVDNTVAVYPVVIEAVTGGYTLKDVKNSDPDDNYLCAAGGSNNNYLKLTGNSSAETAIWTIEITNGVAHIESIASSIHGQMRFNPNSSGTPLFSCYASNGTTGSKDLALYIDQASAVQDTRTPVTLSFDPASPADITIGDNFAEPLLTVNPDTAPVSYSVVTVPSGIATIDSDSGDLTITGVGTITVTASVSDEVNYKPASATYTFKVKAVQTGYETIETSTVALSTDGGTSAAAATVNGNAAIKAGTTKVQGAVQIKVPAGTTKLHLHAVGWNGETVTVGISGATATPSSLDLTSNSAISGSGSSFSLSDVEDYYFCVELSGISVETTLTFTATSGNRFVIWGVNYEAGPDNRQEAGMSWSANSATAIMEDSGNTFTAPTLNLGHASSVTYNSTEPTVATIDDSGDVTLVGDGTTEIQAIFAGDTDYKPQTVEYTLTVTDNRTPVVNYDFETVAELNALATSTTGVEKFGKLTDAVVSYVPDSGNAIIKDATGSVLLYKSDHQLLQGQTFTGDLHVTVKSYNSCSELTACDADFVGAETVVAPATPTLAQLVGNLSTWQNAYVSVSGLEVTAVSGKNVTVSDGTNSYIVFSSAANATCVVGDVITVVGTVAHFGDNDQIKAWKATDITVTYHPVSSHTITLTQPTGAAATAGCSISAKKISDNSVISSGDSLPEGTEITITATEGTDYSFVSWTVTGVTLTDATANPATFTVGTSDVTISAGFKDNNSTAPDPETIDFSTLNLVNSNEYTDPFNGGNFTVAFSSGSKYYNTGTAMRVYGGGSFTVASTYKIAKIDLTFGSGDGTNAITTNVVTFSSPTWTGSSNSVTFNVGGSTGHRRIKAIKVTYEGNSGPQTPTTYALTWDAPTNGSITVTAGGSTISSGAELAEGTNVVITANPATGYELAALVYNDGTEHNIKSSKSFQMPAHAVSISATFTQTQQSGGSSTVTFTFGTAPSAYYVNSTPQSVITEGVITITGEKGTGTTVARSWSDGFRMYAGNTVTFSADSGYVITKIEGYSTFDFTGSQQTVTFSGLSKATCGSDVTVTYQASN